MSNQELAYYKKLAEYYRLLFEMQNDQLIDGEAYSACDICKIARYEDYFAFCNCDKRKAICSSCIQEVPRFRCNTQGSEVAWECAACFEQGKAEVCTIPLLGSTE